MTSLMMTMTTCFNEAMRAVRKERLRGQPVVFVFVFCIFVFLSLYLCIFDRICLFSILPLPRSQVEPGAATF